MKEAKNNTIEIKDLSYRICHKIIEFLYTKETRISDPDEALELLKSADKYQMDGLKKRCEAFLTTAINRETLEYFWEQALYLSAKDLEISIVEWVLMNLESEKESEEGIDLIKKLMENDRFVATLKTHIVHLFEVGTEIGV